MTVLDSELKRQIHRQAANLGIVRETDPWEFTLNQISLHFAVHHNWDLQRISKIPLRNVLELLHDEGTDSDNSIPDQDVHFSSDYAIVMVKGRRFTFNRTQARVVELLHDEMRKGTVGLHQDTIGQRLQSCNSRFRLFHVFRNKDGKMHPLWGKLIVRVEPGIYALQFDISMDHEVPPPMHKRIASPSQSSTQSPSQQIV